jgi:hypothetical protein
MVDIECEPRPVDAHHAVETGRRILQSVGLMQAMPAVMPKKMSRVAVGSSESS